MQKVVLAADMGGTNIRMAAVGREGNILSRKSTRTPVSDGAEAIVDELILLAADVCEGIGSALTMGIAAPGAIDAAAGKILQSPNIPSVDEFELAPRLAEKLGLRVILENDANAAAIGESWIGASRGISNSICVTLGTGVGGGVIIDGKLLRGATGAAGEIGHMSVVYNGEPCGCGSFGCIEQYASATAIVRMAAETVQNTNEYRDSPLAGRTEFTSEDVYDAGAAGDAAALAVFRSMGEYLGTSLAGLVNLLNPELIVIGGGAAAGWDLFIGHTRELIDKKAYRRSAERVKIVRAILGDDAGIIGAAKLALDAASPAAA